MKILGLFIIGEGLFDALVPTTHMAFWVPVGLALCACGGIILGAA